MTTDRPYRDATTEQDVRDELKKRRGIQFDPDTCDALLSAPNVGRLFDENDSGNIQSLTQVSDIIRMQIGTSAMA